MGSQRVRHNWATELKWLKWRSLLCSSVYSCCLFIISSAPIRSIPFLSFIVPIFVWNASLLSLIFSKRSLYSFPFYHFPLFLWMDHLGRLSYLSLLFLGTLHSNGYIFPFLLCLSKLFVRPPQTAILPFCISFSWGWFTNLSPQFSRYCI